MRLSKREFLKSLGIGAAVTSLANSPRAANMGAPPNLSEPALTEAPGPRTLPPSAIPGDWFDCEDDILYDRVTFSPGAELPEYVRFFSVSIGHSCPHTGVVKTHSHTNVDIACCLPAPSSFWVRRIHVGIDPSAIPADVKLARELSWNFWLGDRRYAGGPFAMDMQKRSVIDLLKGKTEATRASLQFEHGKRLYLPCQYQFHGDVRTARYRDYPEYHTRGMQAAVLSKDGNGLEMMMVLEGVRWRAVQ
jgi:hypothetical protein